MPILFAVYLSGIFKDVEKEVEGCIATSFADDSVSLVMAHSKTQLCGRLDKAGTKVVEWRERN